MISHAKVETHADGPDSTKVQPSDWNAEHLMTGGVHGGLLYRDTGASNGYNFLAPTASAGYALVSNGVGAIPSWAPVITPNFPIAATAGGTGVSNAAGSTITLGGAVVTGGAVTIAGAFGLTLTLTALTSLTLPLSGTVIAVAAPGTSGQPLLSAGVGANPAFGNLTVPFGGTGSTTQTQHGVLLGQGAAAITATAVGTTGQVLRGQSGADPIWGQAVLTTDVTGILPVANGGTGVNTLAIHGVVIGNAAGVVSVASPGTAGQVLTSNGAAADPTMQGPVVQTTTVTGAQNNFALSTNCRFLRVNNASLTTFSGFAAGYDGQLVTVENIGTQQIDFIHNSGLSSAGNKFNNFVTSGNTSLATGGVCTFRYDATSAFWRLIEHEQGAWITRTFAASNYTASTGTWTVSSATRDAYYLKGRKLTYSFSTAGATSSTPISVIIALPAGYKANAVEDLPIYNHNNGSGSSVGGYANTVVGSNSFSCQQFGNAAYAAGSVIVMGQAQIELQ